jgi:hypothetical protein
VAKTKKLVAKFEVTAANRTDTEQNFIESVVIWGVSGKKNGVSSFLQNVGIRLQSAWSHIGILQSK